MRHLKKFEGFDDYGLGSLGNMDHPGSLDGWEKSNDSWWKYTPGLSRFTLFGDPAKITDFSKMPWPIRATEYSFNVKTDNESIINNENEFNSWKRGKNFDNYKFYEIN